MAKAACWTVTDVEARKRGEQTGLDTLVVHALNDEYQVSAAESCRCRSKRSKYSKLKGIDGDPHKRWSMWFNSKQREEPYQILTSR